MARNLSTVKLPLWVLLNVIIDSAPNISQEEITIIGCLGADYVRVNLSVFVV